MEFYGKW